MRAFFGRRLRLFATHARRLVQRPALSFDSGQTLRAILFDYGAHQFSADLATELASRGHGVSYWYPSPTPTPNSAHVAFAAGTSLVVDRIQLRRPFCRHGAGRVLSEVELAVRLILRFRKVDRGTLLILSCAPLLSQLAAVAFSPIFGLRNVVWLQDLYGVGFTRWAAARGQAWKTAARLVVFAENVTLRRADLVIAISEGFAQMAQAQRPDRSVIVQPNWSRLGPVHLPDIKLRTEMFGEGGPVAVYTGTLGLKHGQEALGVLSAELKRSGARLVVFSEGPAADSLKRIGVEVRPFAPLAVYNTVLAAADVLVAVLTPDASQYSVPSKVNTYLCAGRPIAALLPSENPAARLLRAAGQEVFEPSDVSRFTQAVTRLASPANSSLAADTGARARAFAERSFDPVAIGTRFEDALREVALGHPETRRRFAALTPRLDARRDRNSNRTPSATATHCPRTSADEADGGEATPVDPYGKVG